MPNTLIGTKPAGVPVILVIFLVELALEHLANAAQRTPIGCAGDEGRSFDLMLTINDSIESDLGLSAPSQCVADE